MNVLQDAATGKPFIDHKITYYRDFCTKAYISERSEVYAFVYKK
jgi:hypothetical protein